jgi:hypothetical protein
VLFFALRLFIETFPILNKNLNYGIYRAKKLRTNKYFKNWQLSIQGTFRGEVEDHIKIPKIKSPVPKTQIFSKCTHQHCTVYNTVNKCFLILKHELIIHRIQNQALPTWLGVPMAYINIFYFIANPLKMQKVTRPCHAKVRPDRFKK